MGEPVLGMLTPVINADDSQLALKSQVDVIEGLCLVVSQVSKPGAI